MSSAALLPSSRVWSTRIFKPLDRPVCALVIDDDERIAQALAAVLKVEGFEVKISDCVDCFEIVKRWTPNVVLLDIEMPFLNGFGVAKELRKLSQCADTPIVAHTSLPEDAVLLQGIPAGIDAYCRKGNALDALIALLGVMAPSR